LKCQREKEKLMNNSIHIKQNTVKSQRTENSHLVRTEIKKDLTEELHLFSLLISDGTSNKGQITYLLRKAFVKSYPHVM